MSDTTNNETSIKEEQASPEEMARMRATMIKYYSEQNKLLKVQADYEKHLADIEESRAKRLTMTIRIAQIMAGPQEDESKKSDENE